MSAEGEPCERTFVRARERPRRGEAARSRKDKWRAEAAMSGGAPDLFEWSWNLIRSQRACLFS